MTYENSISRALCPVHRICRCRCRGSCGEPSDIYKDEYGRSRSEEQHHDAGGSLPVPHRSDHRLPRFLRLSDLRYR